MARHDWTDGDFATAARLDGLPGGVAAYVVGSSSAQSGIGSSATDITSLSVTWTAESARLYVVVLWVLYSQVSSGGVASASINDSGGGSTYKSARQTLAASEEATLVAFSIESGLSGSTTRKGRFATSAGTATINPASSAHRAPQMIVLDLGPA